jgi:hypothetical protein
MKRFFLNKSSTASSKVLSYEDNGKSERRWKLEKKKKITLGKRRSGRDRYSRDLMRHYKTLALRQNSGQRVEGTERFLNELKDLVKEHSAGITKIKLCKAS